ncbi:hypothetical protein F441_10580 [Phytophthora nicotianae CJ01A1]|uniref:Uncharacterized protein n=6 Tax=Phytophthora nicotianae TaxID=4792 RepID=W2R996_PHYN3|nr:hypothetical protein PPTG_21174 [Phytophthora nicotianae INRA-310]ETI44684.1 hypothetical protein F443_10640 [Phytophthora nicotianae P1569]ETK84657.1 hypothetical protein L915_10400 [Phytophthora nicotianae]ETO73298.1 hypothetical protein F444_10740 [Phytophthora nicotianae P1976]ETP14458.1 hypothetical protein F441_10580 [Phytophthora nicotianae CJ01A1]ETP42567.1 hypothetical protein F442_10539 [Phytophthora nicotianae P10297]
MHLNISLQTFSPSCDPAQHTGALRSTKWSASELAPFGFTLGCQLHGGEQGASFASLRVARG